MTKVTIKDELMGTRMIEEINNSHPDQRYIVVVPFLAEAHSFQTPTQETRMRRWLTDAP